MLLFSNSALEVMESSKISGRQIFPQIYMHKICSMLPPPRIDLDFWWLLTSLLQEKPRTCYRQTPLGSRQWKGEIFASVAYFLSHGKYSTSFPGYNRVGQRFTLILLCFVFRTPLINPFISSHPNSAPSLSPPISILALLMLACLQVSGSLPSPSEEAEGRFRGG